MRCPLHPTSLKIKAVFASEFHAHDERVPSPVMEMRPDVGGCRKPNAKIRVFG
jgi:hypothetical protein